jgi:hypothetical protein
MSGYQGCYQRAYRCLSAAGEIFEDVRAILLTQALSEKLAKRAKSIAEHAFPKQPDKGPGQVKQRFLGAVTCKGTLCLYDTALAQCGEIYELYDPCGLAHELLLHLLTEITAAGYDVVACLDPMAPGRLAHLLIPEKGVAFLSTTAALPFPGKPQRRIRMDSVADRELLHRSRPRLRFAQRVSAAILDEGMDSLAEAKALHDQLEALYNPHVDFHRVGEIARNMGDEILAEIG